MYWINLRSVLEGDTIWKCRFNRDITLTMKVDFIFVRRDPSCMKRVGPVYCDTVFTPHLLIINELDLICFHGFTGQHNNLQSRPRSKCTFHSNDRINHWKVLCFNKTLFQGRHIMQGWENIICQGVTLASSYQYHLSLCQVWGVTCETAPFVLKYICIFLEECKTKTKSRSPTTYLSP